MASRQNLWIPSAGLTVALALMGMASCDALTGVGDLEVVLCVADCGSSPADGGVDAPSCEMEGAACGVDPPPGWTVAILGPPDAACPSGSTSIDVFESPAADAGACPCPSCSIPASPSCKGSITTLFDNGGLTCGATGVTVPASSVCAAGSGTAATDALLTGPSPSGTCVASAPQPDLQAVASTPSRLCLPPCGASNCGLSSALSLCVEASGDRPCPPPFDGRHLVGMGVSLSCGSCACSLSGGTCTGTLKAYMDPTCGGPPLIFLVDGVCHATNAAGLSFEAYEAELTAKDAGCVLSPGAPTAGLTGATTVCCM